MSGCVTLSNAASSLLLLPPPSLHTEPKAIFPRHASKGVRPARTCTSASERASTPNPREQPSDVHCGYSGWCMRAGARARPFSACAPQRGTAAERGGSAHKLAQARGSSSEKAPPSEAGVRAGAAAAAVPSLSRRQELPWPSSLALSLPEWLQSRGAAALTSGARSFPRRALFCGAAPQDQAAKAAAAPPSRFLSDLPEQRGAASPARDVRRAQSGMERERRAAEPPPRASLFPASSPPPTTSSAPGFAAACRRARAQIPSPTPLTLLAPRFTRGGSLCARVCAAVGGPAVGSEQAIWGEFRGEGDLGGTGARLSLTVTAASCTSIECARDEQEGRAPEAGTCMRDASGARPPQGEGGHYAPEKAVEARGGREGEAARQRSLGFLSGPARGAGPLAKRRLALHRCGRDARG